jgi:CheY-like chemotaxis protein
VARLVQVIALIGPKIGLWSNIETTKEPTGMKAAFPTSFSLPAAKERHPCQYPRHGHAGTSFHSLSGATNPPRLYCQTSNSAVFAPAMPRDRSPTASTSPMANHPTPVHERSPLSRQELLSPSSALPLAFEQARAFRAPRNRILIADDDAVVRGSLAAVLESEGYLVDEARNGMEAVACAIEHSPDLILLDLNMPHWDGWTAFGQLDRVTPLLPVIVITARPNQYEKAVRLGVDAFMEKPLNISVLVGAIKNLSREDKRHHIRRVTGRGFVTKLLSSADSEP